MLYFNHGERGGRERMEEASKTGIVARNAYTIVPVVMVIGVVLTAVADELVILHPHEMEHPSTAWLICGGPAVYVLGNLLFKRVRRDAVAGCRTSSPSPRSSCWASSASASRR